MIREYIIRIEDSLSNAENDIDELERKWGAEELPKGHGRLIDVSNIMTVTDYDGENEKTYIPYDEIKNAPTIIDADLEEVKKTRKRND